MESAMIIFLDEAASHNIMEHLLTKNYDHIDAALAYGKSNNIIKSFPKKNFQHIYSKFSYNDSKTISKGIHDCRQVLGVDKLEGVYLHDVNDFIKYKDLAKEIESAKEQKLIKYFGASLYRPDDLNKVDLDLIDILQIPINILDNRFSMTGIIEECKNRGIQIFGRSIFLQGLLLMSKKQRPLWSKDYEKFFNVIDKLCIKLNFRKSRTLHKKYSFLKT